MRRHLRHNSSIPSSTMSKMARQVVALSACTLALSAILAIATPATQDKTKSSIVSYHTSGIYNDNIIKKQRPESFTSVHGNRPTRSSHRATDLNSAASSAAPLGYVPPLSQPSVYHSIIDRTAISGRPASSAVQSSTATVGDLNTAAGHHHGHAHGKYYEYRSVPKKKTWKFGYKRGNHKHTISRHEHGKAGKHPHFKTKVKWHDKKSKGKGIHLWDYNHHDKKHYQHG